jgi:hypothetical protein
MARVRVALGVCRKITRLLRLKTVSTNQQRESISSLKKSKKKIKQKCSTPNWEIYLGSKSGT